MNRKQQALESIKEQRILPLFYHDDELVSIDILKSLYGAGLRAVEYTNRGEHALRNFKAMKRECLRRMPGMKIGVGTVKTTDEARQFIEADAEFIVSPMVNPEVGQLALEAGLLWIPGCMTPTEIGVAEANGAVLVKLFPANVISPSYVKAVREVFPKMHFMPTGGVLFDQENLRAWFNAGVMAVGLGSKLISKTILQNKQYDQLQYEAAKAMGLAQSVK